MRHLILQFLMLAGLGSHVDAQVPSDSVLSAAAHRIWILTPDRATFFVVVDDTGSTEVEAITKLETRVPRLRTEISRFAPAVVAEPPVLMHVGPRPTSNPHDPRQLPIPFIARTMIRVNASRTDSLPRLFTAIYGAGATVASITFFSSVADSVRKARLPELIAIARGEAEVTAKALGGQLGALMEVVTTGGVGYEAPTTLTLDSRWGGSVPIPQMNVPSGVTLKYRLARP